MIGNLICISSCREVINLSYVEELRKIVGTRPLILVGSICIILNDKNEVLLQQRTYPYGVWGLPGGLMELGESTEDCARREVFEETGLTLGELQLLNVSSGPQSYVVAQNGDEYYAVTMIYVTNDIIQGTASVHDDESLNIQYYPLNNLPEKMVGSHRKAINDFLARK